MKKIELVLVLLVPILVATITGAILSDNIERNESKYTWGTRSLLIAQTDYQIEETSRLFHQQEKYIDSLLQEIDKWN
jgi:hypothetical protein